MLIDQARILFVFVLVAGLPWAGCGPPAQSKRPPVLGDRVDEGARARRSLRQRLTLPRFGQRGQVAVLGKAGDKATLIFMFTTWSLRSQMEAPRFVQLHERLRKKGLRVVGVVLDRKTAKTMIKTYIDFVGIRFDVAQAEPNHLDLTSAFGPTRQVPRMILLDARGATVRDDQGTTVFARLDDALRGLLR